MAKKKPSRKQEAEDVRLLGYARSLLDAHAYERYVRESRAPKDELLEIIGEFLDEWWYGAPIGDEDLATRILDRFAIMGRDQADELSQRAREHPLVQELACCCVYDLEAQEFAVMCEQHRDLIEVQD